MSAEKRTDRADTAATVKPIIIKRNRGLKNRDCNNSQNDTNENKQRRGQKSDKQRLHYDSSTTESDDEDSDTESTESEDVTDMEERVVVDGFDMTDAIEAGLGIEDCLALVELTTKRAYGYKYDKYITGKRKTDVTICIWHVFVLLISAVVITISILIGFKFGDLMMIASKHIPSNDVYRTFVWDPVFQSDFFFDDDIYELCVFSIIFNVVYLTVTLVYFSYYKHPSPFSVPTTCLFTSFLVIVEILFVNVYHDVEPFVDKMAEIVIGLQHRIHEEYKVQSLDSFSIAYDHMAIWLQCCGIVDMYDFGNTSLLYNGNTKLLVPPVCCKREIFEAGVERVVKCATEMRDEDIYQVGCMEKYSTWVSELCFVYGCFVWVHVVDCFIHAWIYRRRIRLIKAVLGNTFPEDGGQYLEAEAEEEA